MAMYDIELKRLQNTDKHCLNLAIVFELKAEDSAQKSEIGALRDKVKKLDQAVEADGLRMDFGRAVVLQQSGYQELLVFGLLELTDRLPDPAATAIVNLFNTLATTELGPDHHIMQFRVDRCLPTPKFFPDFLKE